MMKKYLMTGIAAVAMGAAFTACSHDEITPMSQAEQTELKYEQAFIQKFGQPSPNQTWGFGSITRAQINVNGNLWKTCPELGETEDADVTAYVRALETYPKVAPTGLENYFVTQVHCGTDTYYDKDGNGPILGSSKMNHLMIAMDEGATITDGVLSEGWYHINNFNRGDDTDWKGNTLVIEGATLDFAYIGSEDSKYHNKWIAIDGKDIDAAKYGNYCYVCFDFEQSANAKTVIKFRDENGDPQQGYIDGAWDKTKGIDQVMGKTVVIDVYNWETGETTKVTYTVGQEGTTEWELDNVVNGNQIVDGDNDYTDWIIRLVKAEPKDDIVYNGRVIAEDLTVKEQGDFDFNDVVFDYAFNQPAGKTTIKLLAAGGTLPLYVGGHEVHLEFGEGTGTMINTGEGSKTVDKTPTFTLDGTFDYDANKIEVKVIKKDNEGNPEEHTLYAIKGRAPSKINVGTDYEWCNERQDIDDKFNGNFSKWVKGEITNFYK